MRLKQGRAGCKLEPAPTTWGPAPAPDPSVGRHFKQMLGDNLPENLPEAVQHNLRMWQEERSAEFGGQGEGTRCASREQPYTP